MRVLALSGLDCASHLDLVMGMHRLRRRVFKDRLNWDVSVSGDMEIDIYDTLHPTYLVGITSAGTVAGCARFLPTTGPNMLANTFSVLLDGYELPRSSRIFESSRFCVDSEGLKEKSAKGLQEATFSMLAAVLEWGLANNQVAVVTVTDIRFERILKRACWPLERFAPPQRIGDTLALAGRLPITEQALSVIRDAGELPGPVLVSPPFGELAA